MKKSTILLLSSLLSFFNLHSQILENSWTDHMSYYNGQIVCNAETKIYCATEASLFYVDKDDNSMSHLSPIDGLAEIGIGYIAYSNEYKKLVIGYSNGNIDIITDNLKIAHLSGLKDKQFAAEKKINHINIVDNIAYLACNFGLVSIDINRKEFKDTYVLGENGRWININQSIVYDKYLYALTDSGLIRGRADHPFLVDIKNWERIKDIEQNLAYKHCCVADNKLYVSLLTNNEESYRIVAFDGAKWETIWDNIADLKSLTSNHNQLVVTTKNSVTLYNNTLNIVAQYNGNNAFKMGIVDEMGTIWFANSYYGLGKYADNKLATYAPNGPVNNNFYSVAYNAGDILVAPGGRASTNANLYRNANIYTYSNNQWSSLNADNFPDIDKCRDITHFVTTNKKNHYFAIAWRYGLIEYKDGKYSLHNSESTNNILSSEVSDCKLDRNGNLWLTSSFSENNIAVRSTKGEWYSYSFDNIFTGVSTDKIMCMPNNDIWVTTNHGYGILAFNYNKTIEHNNDDTHVHFFPIDANNNQLNANINAIAIDRNNIVWIASNEGVYIYEHPEKVLEGNFIARYPQMVKDGFYQSLLSTEVVKTIAIDDNNNKWFGTVNSGIFVISPDGTQQYAEYNTSNSPLFSNNVMSLCIDNNKGELYIVTDKGLQSAKIVSSERKADLENIYAYPNPVTPDFNGEVAIRGLMDNTVVRITDLHGDLVYETMSAGGGASWNLYNTHGNRVATGIYLIQGVTQTGEFKNVGKIHVIK